MSLHNKYIDPTNGILVKEKVVVTIDRRRAKLLVFSCEQNLIVMSIYDKTISDAFLNVIRSIVTVHN